MKKTMLLIGFVISIILISNIAFGQARLTIPEADFDFGYVPQHSKISHVYWLHSTGTEMLKIDKVKPGCGCTKAPLEKDKLVVGDSAQLEIIFSTRSYRGRQSKRPLIKSNGEVSDMNVKFSAEVITNPDSTYPIIIEPYKFDISQFGDKKRSELSFEIRNISNEDIKVKLIDMPANMFKLKLPKKIKAGETKSGKIEIMEDFISAEFEKSLTIELSDKASSRFTIPIKRTLRVPGDKKELSKKVN